MEREVDTSASGPGIWSRENMKLVVAGIGGAFFSAVLTAAIFVAICVGLLMQIDGLRDELAGMGTRLEKAHGAETSAVRAEAEAITKLDGMTRLYVERQKDVTVLEEKNRKLTTDLSRAVEAESAAVAELEEARSQHEHDAERIRSLEVAVADATEKRRAVEEEVAVAEEATDAAEQQRDEAQAQLVTVARKYAELQVKLQVSEAHVAFAQAEDDAVSQACFGYGGINIRFGGDVEACVETVRREMATHRDDFVTCRLNGDTPWIETQADVTKQPDRYVAVYDRPSRGKVVLALCDLSVPKSAG